ncbi:MAG: DUF4271 domain-containing protein [Bacteroidales bacterium]|jgi:hypothetical protein|nr:DUF4271 domain-containing protein [Bacteroidales bacterium]
MTKTSATYCFPGIQQDTLIKPRQNQPNITIRRPQLDLERAEEVMRQFEQREQEIIASQRRAVKPKPVETLRAPSIETDTLLAKYRYIGCSPRANFPDTFTLTLLERYYQPITTTVVSAATITDSDATGSAAAMANTAMMKQDSVQTIIPVTAAETSTANTGLASDIKPVGYPSSVTLFITCGLVLLAVIKYNFGRNLRESFQSFFSYRQAQRMYEERRESDRQADILSHILSMLVAGIFVSVILPFFGANPLWGSYALSIPVFSLATGLLYTLKSWIWQALGIVFLARSFSRVYIYNMFLYNRNIGLMIFPLVAVIPYITRDAVPYFIYGVIVVFALSYLLKLGRIFQIIHAQNVPLFYFILYLCTLEILPLLLFIKGCKMLSENVFM